MSDPKLIEHGRHMMIVWCDWRAKQLDERGWPDKDSIGRAAHQAQTATERNGIARWKGKGSPPAMPKQTRAAAGTIVPDIDRAGLGPMVDRILLDLDAMGCRMTTTALKVDAFHSDKPEKFRASLVEIIRPEGTKLISQSNYRMVVREGYAFLSGRFNSQKR